jgi:aspartyl-tRNA(Asn)/glutamyl-tRNA(Gln) amidotransferase subunit A
LKPSYGRVSRYGVTAFASSLDQVGPIVKTVEDAAILLGAIAGADPHDQTVLDREVPDYRAALAGASLKGLRIGVPKEYFIDGCDPEVMASVRKAIDMCANAGAEVKEISLPHTEYAIAVYYICATAEASANLARFDGIRYGFRKVGPEATLQSLYDRSRTDGFGKEVKRRIILGTYVLSSGYYDAYYNRALKARTLIRNDFQKAFESCDVIMTPVAPTAAYKLNSTVNDPLKAYLGDIFTVPANLAGICGISVPCGKTSENLPVGLQLLGPAFGEVELLRAAAACEKEFA